MTNLSLFTTYLSTPIRPGEPLAPQPSNTHGVAQHLFVFYAQQPWVTLIFDLSSFDALHLESQEDDGTVAVPQPPTIPLLGNLDTFDRNVPLNSFVHFWKTYGEIYQVDIGRSDLAFT